MLAALLDRIREPSAGVIAELGAKNFCNQQRMSDIQPLKHASGEIKRSAIREVSAPIAAAVAAVARGLATVPQPNDLMAFIEQQMYDPRY
jgi:hypothetical protein